MVRIAKDGPSIVDVTISLDFKFDLDDLEESITLSINEYLNKYLGDDVVDALTPEQYKVIVNRLITMFLDRVG